MYGAGTGKNCEEAEKYANFEALERIANSINCRNEIVETYNNLKRNKVDLDKFPMISKKEYSMNTKLDKNQLIDWVECVDIINKELKMIPSSYVYLYNSELFQGDKITNPISTGAALHENYNKAIINGIYEVIERDGIALTWLIKKTNGNVNHLFTEDE
ncbi:YcaO-like family protein, partial [Staphylococcus pseudintermedius]|nr:YcaO-like family protein [Staphylococcus pseudintermedius]